jgi:hypothetical protein
MFGAGSRPDMTAPLSGNFVCNKRIDVRRVPKYRYSMVLVTTCRVHVYGNAASDVICCHEIVWFLLLYDEPNSWASTLCLYCFHIYRYQLNWISMRNFRFPDITQRWEATKYWIISRPGQLSLFHLVWYMHACKHSIVMCIRILCSRNALHVACEPKWA